MPEAPRADSPCPDLAELLLASEGELPKRRQRELSDHARHCSTCRATLGNADRALSEYQDAYETPERRADEATAAAGRTAEFRVRLREEQRTTAAANVRRASFRSWLPIAAAVPVLVAAFFMSSRYSAVVRAEELITRAVAQEESVPVGTVRRVEIRVTPASRAATAADAQNRAWSMTRELGLTRAVSTSAANANPENDALAALLASNHFDWRDPLSVRAFRAWRDSLTHKSDSVTFPDPDTLALRTTTPDGVLRSAVLIVRRVDFQPIEQTLDFDGFGQVRIIELSRWIKTTPEVAETSTAPTPIVATAAPNPGVLDETELDVRKALHNLSLDGTSAITVTRSGHAVEVRGRIDARHKAEIARAVSHLAPVKVLMRAASEDSAAAPAPADSQSEHVDAAPLTPGAPPLQRWLDRTFGQGDRSAMFLGALSANAEQVRQRTAAFASLAARYPESEAQRLASPAQKKLAALADEQYRDVVKAVEALDDRLALFLGTTTRGAPADSTPRPWQACAASLVTRAEVLHHAIDRLLHEPDLPLPTEIGPGADEPLPLANLRRADDALWMQLRSARSDQLEP